ncbi:gliding motility-associated C-terminal domain-containing protein, partial [Crocinitomicaceae bacterium]|nr:gliding motility-associated C-terminal domain-containing protein [Crocinitomicaceae bacterium]
EGYGGGIFNRSGTVDLNNSLIAYNRNINDIENANLIGIESDEDLFGSFTSTSGSNLVFNLGAGSLGGNTLGNIISADPELMPLADNGGTTFTHAILPCPQGPAVNAGNDAAAPTLDQREMPRNDAADIGSFESDLAEINLSYSMIQPCENSSNGSITVTPQSTPDYIYQWDVSTGNQTESTAIGLVAGIYTVTITDGNGCVKDTTFELIQAPNPSLDPFTNQEECESFTLLEITGTNLSGDESYYTESGGLGTSLIEGDVITSTQTIYMYDLLGNCADEVSFDVIIHELPEVLSFTGEGEYCEGELPQNIIVEVSGVSDFTLEYTINGAQASIVSSEQNIDLGNTPGVYMITGIQDEFCENTSDLTQSIIVHLLPSAPETSGDQSFCTNEMILPIEAQAEPGSHSWYSDEGLTQFLSAEDQYLPENTPGIDTYYVTSTENDCEGPAQAVVIEIKICDVVIPTAFTPNDDDVNDIWNIVNIDLVYPNNVVRVYNRLGNKVYESQKGKYQEMSWNGFYNLEALPVASYYYIIEYNDDNNKSDTGYVSIIK